MVHVNDRLSYECKRECTWFLKAKQTPRTNAHDRGSLFVALLPAVVILKVEFLDTFNSEDIQRTSKMQIYLLVVISAANRMYLL